MAEYLTYLKELSDALGISEQAVRQHRCGVKPHPLLLGLPAPAATRPRLTWWTADIDAWVDSRRTFRPQDSDLAGNEAGARGRGRPRKGEA